MWPAHVRTSVLGAVWLSLSFGAGGSLGANILIDNYYFDATRSSSTRLAAAVRAEGHTVLYFSHPITPYALIGRDVYVLFYPGAAQSISVNEADTIASWVAAGHGLWLGGSYLNNAGVADNCNRISARWGITFNSDDYSGQVTDITPGQVITDGINPPGTQVSSFGLYTAGTLTLTQGQSLARTGGRTVLAAAEPGSGRVALINDSVSVGPFDDTYWDEYNNSRLALNTVDYLVPEPPMFALALGLVLVARRRT